jgi:hypothetical protein
VTSPGGAVWSMAAKHVLAGQPEDRPGDEPSTLRFNFLLSELNVPHLQQAQALYLNCRTDSWRLTTLLFPAPISVSAGPISPGLPLWTPVLDARFYHGNGQWTIGKGWWKENNSIAASLRARP